MAPSLAVVIMRMFLVLWGGLLQLLLLQLRGVLSLIVLSLVDLLDGARAFFPFMLHLLTLVIGYVL